MDDVRCRLYYAGTSEKTCIGTEIDMEDPKGETGKRYSGLHLAIRSDLA